MAAFRQPGNAERAADADRPVENARGKLRQSGELARAAGEDGAGARLGRERRGRETVADHFENFLDPRLDDAHQTRARHELRRLAVVVVDRRHRDHVALVRSSREHAAVERLDSLGIRDTSVQPACQVHRDVVAAEREAVGMDEAAAGEHRHGGGAGAHVDQGRAEIGLVVGDHRKPGDIGRRHHGLDREMAALDHQHQVARRRDVGGHHVHVDAEFARQHAARLADAAHAVERIADRQRMQHDAAGAHRMLAAGRQRAGDVAVGDAGAGDVDVDRVEFAGGPAGRHRQHHRFKLHRGVALGEIDGVAHRLLGLRQIDHRAALDAARPRCGRCRESRCRGCAAAAPPAAPAA